MKTLASLLLLALAANADAAPSGLDPVFGTDGIAAIDAVAPYDADATARAAVLVRDGFTYLHVGSNAAGLVVSRQQTLGDIDRSWARDGAVELTSDTWELTATAAAMQSHRRLVIAGYATARDDGRVVPLLCRILGHGVPDPRMQRGGDAPPGCRFGLPSGEAHAKAADEAALALSVRADDSLLVASRAGSGAKAQLHVNSLDADGAPRAFDVFPQDPLLAQAFITLLPTQTLQFDAPLPIAGLVQDGERILLAGTVTVLDAAAAASRRDMFVMAFGMDGVPMQAFGDDDMAGLTRIGIESANEDTTIALRRAPDGGLVIAGTTLSTEGDLQPVVVRLRADGTRDTAYGEGSIALLPHSSTIGWNGLSDMVVDAEGRAVIAGSVLSTMDGHQIGVVRRRADGSLDPAFGDAGMVRFDFAPEAVDAADALDWVSSIALAWPTERVMVGGQAEGVEGEFRLARLRWF